MNKSILFFVTSLILGVMPAVGKVTHMLPKPQQIEEKTSSPFVLQRSVRVVDETNSTALTRFLEETNCVVTTDETAPVIEVELVSAITGAYDYELSGYPNEAYTLSVEADRIHITAITPTGVIRAAQTLTQLAEGYDGVPEIEAVDITDWPAFKLRGMMHDIGRSFITVDEIKKELDLFARFKLNTFHFHLTENQAWRFEVKQYPDLTSESSMTRFPGQYYTQEQCRDIETYAAERGIIVIPEIDMPGHSEAFTRAMGYNMQTAAGVEALKNILDEVVTVFPKAPYIHIGADEVGITYPNFLKIMTDKIHSLGKKVVCWNPISGVTINTSTGFDMTQMWSSSGRVITGMPNIDCRYNYINHFDVYADLVGIYKSTIYYAERGSSDIAGTITAVWNDRKTPTQNDILKQNNVYANTLASLERAWIGGGAQYIEEGGTTLPNTGNEFTEFADWERRFLFHKANSLKDEPIPYVKQTNIRWRITDAFPNGGDKNASFPPEDELKDSYEYNGNTYGTGLATGGGIYLRHTWGSTIPTYYSNPQTNQTAYAWTWVYSPEAQTVGAQIEFQNYGRSEKDLAPANGTWDYKGSRVWVNDEEILPPTWENAGKSITNEVELKNENFTARQVSTINLQQGWNKVFLKLPYITLANTTVRLNKWMFTFVLTTPDGKNAVEGLVYSPSKTLDESAESLVALLEEVKYFRNSVIGTTPGYYPESAAASLDAVISEVEETLDQELGDEARAEQLARLQEAYDTFKTTYTSASIIKPKASSENNVYRYTMKTPNRDNRYVTSHGSGSKLTGEMTSGETAYWKFVERGDGTYNIINCSDNTYINPTSVSLDSNTAFATTSSVPSSGWSLLPSSQIGLFIIVSGSNQFNQQNHNNNGGYYILNWGDGTNKTDTGCQYMLEEVDGEVTPPVPTPGDGLTPIYSEVNLSFDGESAPIRVPDEYAQPIMSAEEMTVAVDYTYSASDAVANVSMTLTGATNTSASMSFLSVILNGGDGFGVRWNDNGGWLTKKPSTGIVTGRHKLVVVMTHNAIDYYLDGTNCGRVDEGSASWPMVFSEVSNPDALYLGGVVTSTNDNKLPFKGTIHSIRYYGQALTAEQVGNLNYDNVVAGIEKVESDKFEVRVVNRVVECDVPFALYSIDGRMISQETQLLPGIYVVKTDFGSSKVVVQ